MPLPLVSWSECYRRSSRCNNFFRILQFSRGHSIITCHRSPNGFCEPRPFMDSRSSGIPLYFRKVCQDRTRRSLACGEGDIGHRHYVHAREFKDCRLGEKQEWSANAQPGMRPVLGAVERGRIRLGNTHQTFERFWICLLIAPACAVHERSWVVSEKNRITPGVIR